MALAPRLDLRQSQTLVMTPQLQQAIKLLQLSNLELVAFVEQELERNPLLERDESESQGAGDESGEGRDRARAPAPPRQRPTRPRPPRPPRRRWWMRCPARRRKRRSTSITTIPGTPMAPATATAVTPTGAVAAGAAISPTTRTASNRSVARDITLRDHLIGQLNMDIADPADRLIGLHLIESLDESGYLTTDLAEIGATLGCPVARVETVLGHLQRFDPPGVFARSLAECLALQLRDRNRLDPAMQALLDHLDLLARRDLAGLMRVCGIDAEDLSEMIAEIRALDPKPALAFDHAPAQPITPDVLMRAAPGGAWIVELNSETLPRVLVNSRYYAKVSSHSKNREDKIYLSERFQSANWLVKSLHQRANTILKVASEIVRQQEAFFQKGVQHLRPLVLRDIAEAIAMHESTVSRVTTNKYIATPRGIFELKYFFTQSIAGADGAEAHSAEAVRHRIKILVEAEGPTAVLSDDRIVEILRKDGVDIARRTVAKYREALRIPSSVQRRREKALGA